MRYGSDNIFAQGMDAFDQSFDRTQNLFDKAADRKAGRALAGGDRRTAMQVYGNAGRVDAVRALETDQQQADDRQTQARQQSGKVLLEALGVLGQIPDPNQRYQALQHPVFQALIPAEELAKVRPEHLTNEQLAAFSKKVEDELQIVPTGDGGYDVVNKRTGAEVRSVKGRVKPFEMDPNKTYIVPDDGGEGGVPDTPIATARPQTDAVFEALIQQESGGRPGVIGPQTDYGQAEGMTQMLPATAEAMARKAGVAWNPALMRERTPQAAEYQRRLGRAYFEEGLQKYGGDVRKALMYYHGGPNERLWGPKTKAYAEQVLARVDGQDQAVGGAGDDAIAPPGYRVLQAGAPKPQGRMATAADKKRLGLPVDGNYWLEADGKPLSVGGEKPNKPLTEYQSKGVEYLSAALSGNDRLNDLASRGVYKPASPVESLIKPDENGLIRIVARTPQDRAYVQASMEFLAPILRKDTGAAVTFAEFMFYKDIYIPVFEDDPATMMQKAKARDAKLRAIYGANRQAYDQTFGAPGQWKVLTDPRGKGGAPARPSQGKKDPNSITVDGVTMTVRPK